LGDVLPAQRSPADRCTMPRSAWVGCAVSGRASYALHGTRLAGGAIDGRRVPDCRRGLSVRHGRHRL